MTPSSWRYARRAFRLMVALLVFSAITPRTALAYIDPGTGSLAWQLILSTAVGFVFYFRRALASIGRLLSRKRQEKPIESGARVENVTTRD